MRLILWLTVLLLSSPAWGARVASLNLCTDEYLLLLAPEQAVGVTFLARDPALSVVVTQAQSVPSLRADAESVLRLAPDLVLATQWSAQATLNLLERRGIRVARFVLPEGFDGIRRQTREIATLLGAQTRGEALLEVMERNLRIRQPAPRRSLALAPRGWSSGPGSFTDAVLSAAGLVNVGYGGQITLEAIVAHPPELLVLARDPAFPSLATDFLRHPALADIPRRQIPPALLACAGPWSARAVSLLAS
jgi:iron complex transport system substrate-binding protein